MPRGKSNDRAATASTPATAEETAAKVAKKLTEPKEKGVIANLPIVSSLYKDTEEMQKAIASLERAHELNAQISTCTEELKDLKTEIISIAVGAEVNGFRYGRHAALVSMKTRTGLSKDKLLELGVEPEVIAASMVEGDPYYEVRLPEIEQ